jgi:hypothetical protein
MDSNTIKTINLKKGKQKIELDQIYPIKHELHEDMDIKYLIDGEIQEKFFDVFYANELEVIAKKDSKLTLELGRGYIAKKDESFSKHFNNHSGWSGGDGIFSFNLEDENDQFDQNEDKKTLFIFGDTFVGKSDEKTHQRFQPHLMPNNSLAYYHHHKMDFHINQLNDGSVRAFYEMDEKYDQSGSIARNLITYDQKQNKLNYLSGYYPKQVELVFDLQCVREISHMDIFNYFQDEELYLNKRGLKDIEIYVGKSLDTLKLLRKTVINKALNYDTFETLELDTAARYIKIIGLTNHNDEQFKEGLFGLHQVRFYHNKQLYRDIEISTNSTFSIEQNHAWIWLQDGIIINNQLYFIPLVVNTDMNQPEGLQFKITGTALFKTPVKNQKILPEERSQKMAPLLVYKDQSEYLYGAGIMAHTKSSGIVNPDGHIYIYGYKTTMGLREMIVARVKEENFEHFDDWTYFNGDSFVSDIFESKAILAHVSCELSVSRLNKGPYANKYIAVFTYDVNTPYVAFAIGETPYGPFSKPQKIYKTKEKDIFKQTTYTYNAKAHPHLSNSDDVLVTYNTNTYDFDHNMSHCLIYQPRFIRLKDTKK